jgi:nucleoside-diphosphate-sugar epimerase
VVVVMGACGTTASKTAEQMLAQKRRVRVIDKSPFSGNSIVNVNGNKWMYYQ